MRRVTEAPVNAPTYRGDGAFSLMSWRQVGPFFAFAATCYLVAPYLGLDSFDVDPRIAEVWPPGGVCFLLLTTVAVTRKGCVALSLAFMLLVFPVTAVVLAPEAAPALWVAALGAPQPLVIVEI